MQNLKSLKRTYVDKVQDDEDNLISPFYKIAKKNDKQGPGKIYFDFVNKDDQKSQQNQSISNEQSLQANQLENKNEIFSQKAMNIFWERFNQFLKDKIQINMNIDFEMVKRNYKISENEIPNNDQIKDQYQNMLKRYQSNKTTK